MTRYSKALRILEEKFPHEHKIAIERGTLNAESLGLISTVDADLVTALLKEAAAGKRYFDEAPK
jgi:hypothetical protein